MMQQQRAPEEEVEPEENVIAEYALETDTDLKPKHGTVLRPDDEDPNPVPLIWRVIPGIGFACLLGVFNTFLGLYLMQHPERSLDIRQALSYCIAFTSVLMLAVIAWIGWIAFRYQKLHPRRMKRYLKDEDEKPNMNDEEYV